MARQCKTYKSAPLKQRHLCLLQLKANRSTRPKFRKQDPNRPRQTETNRFPPPPPPPPPPEIKNRPRTPRARNTCHRPPPRIPPRIARLTCDEERRQHSQETPDLPYHGIHASRLPRTGNAVHSSSASHVCSAALHGPTALHRARRATERASSAGSESGEVTSAARLASHSRRRRRTGDGGRGEGTVRFR